MQSVRFAFTFICLACTGIASAAPAPFNGKVDIGGCSIQIDCLGVGTPTVIVETELNASATNNPAWRAIAQRVAQLTQICLYDRAGRGESDPPPAGKRSSDDIVADLHLALARAGITRPYLLAGHSIGGIFALDFVRLHPREVAGVVLIDSSHPEQVAGWRRVFPNPTPGEPEAVTHAREVLKNMDHADNPESIDIGESYAEAGALQSLGSRPLIVLTHSSKWKMVPNLPEPVLAKLEAEDQRLQRCFLKLSRRSRQMVAASAGHELPEEDPDLVVAGILDAVKMVRGRVSAGARTNAASTPQAIAPMPVRPELRLVDSMEVGMTQLRRPFSMSSQPAAPNQLAKGSDATPTCSGSLVHAHA